MTRGFSFGKRDMLTVYRRFLSLIHGRGLQPFVALCAILILDQFLVSRANVEL